MATGISGGAKASVAAAFGCTLGIVPSIAACIFGVAAILHTSATAFQVLKYVGVIYLLYLAYQTIRQSRNLVIGKSGDTQKYCWIIRRGLLINILNPKLTIFFLAFLPQFIPANVKNPSLTIAGLGAVFMAITFIVFVLYGLFASKIREKLLSKPKIIAWIQYGVAGTFTGLGLKLALTEQ
ncbi:MAG: LysE family translocator [Sneathiella sp.]|nr:LysE family translocator [Sneathiella sp.]